MIKIKNVSVGYEDKVIIDNLSIDLNKNKVVALIGPNGSGKSTLIKSIARVNKITNGSISVENLDVFSKESKEVAKKISFLPQHLENYNSMSVYDLVCLGRFPYKSAFSSLSKEDYKKVQWAIDTLGLNDIQNKDVNDLSGGQKQRAWIAMVLAQDTPYILLDEPTSYLDINYQLEVLNTIKKLNLEQNKTIIFSHHDINQACKYADEIVVMKDGKVLKYGDSSEVINEEVLKEVFNVKATIIKTKENKIACTEFESISA